jgi:uncharacterized protein (TIGR03083 family)
MHTPEPVNVLHLFGPERAALLDLLEDLTRPQWDAATICPGWTVKDLAAHLLGDDLGIIARWRDDHVRGLGSIVTESWDELVAEINRRNEAWVDAMRRLSPRLLIELLGWAAEPALAAFKGRDPDEAAGPVSWAGPDPAPGWLHVAREFTERWHHQQQIREAVRARLLDDPRFLQPVLATFARALPRAYREAAAASGTQVGVDFNGPAGSRWAVVRHEARWTLLEGPADDPVAVIRIDQDAAWRLFTRGLPEGAAAAAVSVEGDASWRNPFLGAVAILA